MSPLEAAVYMGAPNLRMVNEYPARGQAPTHKPFEPPFEQYAYPLKALKRVAWSIVGAAGATDDSERRQVLGHGTPDAQHCRCLHGRFLQ
jgi:hypothetical protein